MSRIRAVFLAIFVIALGFALWRFSLWRIPAVTVVIASTAAVIAIVVLWRWYFAVDPERLRDEVRVAIEDARAELRDVLFRAQVAGDPADAQARSDELLRALDNFETKVDTATPDELDGLKQRTRWVTSRRAYLVPSAAIDFEAQSKVDDLQSWRLPAEVTDAMKAQLQALRSLDASKDLERRVRLEGIFDDFDYWDEYSDWYIRSSLYPTMLVIVGTFAVCLAGSMLSLLRWHQTVIGFILAGGTGAALSILLKLPPMSVYGDAVGAGPRMVARFAAGVAATAMGFGLLAAGFVNLGIRSQNSQFVGVSELLQSCAGNNPCAEQPVETASLAGSDIPTKAPTGGCDSTGVMLLLAIGIALGFSERALSSFESIVMPPKDDGTPGKGPAGDKGAPQPANVSPGQ